MARRKRRTTTPVSAPRPYMERDGDDAWRNTPPAIKHSKYDSLTALVDYIETLPGDGTFQGWKSYCPPDTEVFTLARNGWRGGMDRARDLAATLVQDVWGGAFDVGALMAGMPEAWTHTDTIERPQAVSIYYDVGSSWIVPEEAINERGTAIMALVCILQSQGVPVTLDVGWVGKSSYDQEVYSIVTRICDANTGGPVDLDRVNFAVTHQGMNRRLNHAAVSHHRRGQHCPATPWGAAPPMNQNSIVVRLPDYADARYDLALGAVHADDAGNWGADRIIAEYNRLTMAR
jgi:hypothetical protein